MDPVRNPFAPGAGSPPPELAGRDDIINDASIALQRILQGRHDQSQILLGLRGTGKTVLLNRIEQIADGFGYLTSFIEAPEDKNLSELIYPRLNQVLRKLSLIENAREQVHRAMRALRGFVSVFKVEMGDVSLSVDPEPGAADSGNLEYDLADLFLRVGEAARAAGKGWAILIDEVQYLKSDDLSALIVAIHKVNQRSLPVVFFGAGLPQIAGLSGDAKSYAERLFRYPPVGPLSSQAAKKAIRDPIEDEEEQISEKALEVIVSKTKGYPYFLQEWGYQVWNISDASPISEQNAMSASKQALKRLDDSFFKVRFDRLTPKEREYVVAMANLGEGPYRTGDIAEKLGEPPQRLGPRRQSIITKGMIYSPEYGDLDFTVPMFAEFLMRTAVQE